MRGDLFDWLGDVTLRFNASGRLAQCNPAAADLLGRSAIGEPWQTVLESVAPGWTGRAQATVPVDLASEGHWRGHLRLADVTGEGDLFAATIVADPDDTGDSGYLVVMRSMADTRRREHSEREIVARDEFVARLGHELRTPLNAVLGFAQLMELEELQRDQRDSVERILTAGRHMQALLDDVLDLARVRSGGVDLDVGPVRVLEVVQGVVDLIQPMADKRGIRRYIEPAHDLVAMLDRRRLWQVLLNLIGNAVKYGREGGIVRVGVTAREGDRIRIEVADDGPGIEPAHLDRLFRPFERLGAQRTGVEGTGLGLALSLALTTAMNGTLSATSRLGAGSIFALDVEAVSAGVLAELSGDEATRSSVGLVLHVGADSGAQALVAQALRSRLGAEVITVSRAAQALAVIKDQQPAVVILDATLPDAVGTELLHRLSGDPLSALVPKIVLAEDSDPRVHLRLRAAGAHQVVQLPLDVRAFVESVRALLPAAPPSAAPDITSL